MNSGNKRNELYQPKLTQYSDDSEVVSVVQILTQNIVQWSFVESQLSEPQVNVNIPEIAIPLKHLSSSLVLLGSVLHSRNDLYESKIVYERACPLVELTIKTDKSEIDDCFNKLMAIYQNMYNKGGVSADNSSVGVSVDEYDAASSNSMSYRRKNRKRNHILNFDEMEDEDKAAPHTRITSSNRQNNETETHNASIQKSSLYSLLSEINVYDTFEIENRYMGDSFNATLRIEELKSQYEHVRRTLQRSTALNSPQPTSTPYESQPHEFVEIEAFWDLPSLRNHANYNHEESKQMFLNIHLLINNYVHGDADDQIVLLRSVNAIAQQGDIHPLYTILATVMSEINSQGSFDDYFDVLEDFFDLTEMNRESFLDALASIESSNLPVSVETQWKLIIIYIFDKAYIELEQGKVFNYLRSQHDDDHDAFHFNSNNDDNETPQAIDFERFADEPSIESDTSSQRYDAVSDDSTSFLLSFLLFVTSLISIGVYQLLRNRNHSHRYTRNRKSGNKGYNDDDFINQMYSFISNDCKKISTDSDTSDSDSRLIRQKAIDTHVAFFSRMYDTASYYFHRVAQGSKSTVENSTAYASLPRAPSKRNKTSNKGVKKGNNSSGTSASNSGKGKGSKSTSQPTVHQESGSMNDDLDSDDSDNSDIVVSDDERTQPKAQVAVTTDTTHIAANIDDANSDSEWVHAGKNSKSTKAQPLASLTSVTSSTVANPPKLKRESNKTSNKYPSPTPLQSNVAKDLSIMAAPRITDVSYTAIVKSNSAVALHTGTLTKASQYNEDKFDVRDDSIGGYTTETNKEMPSSTKTFPEDDDESLLMSIHAHIDSTLMNELPNTNGPTGFENNSTGLWSMSGVGTSNIPSYWNTVPEMKHLDGLFMSNSAKFYPRSDLNLDAPTFIPSTPLNFLVGVNPDLQIIVTVNCISIGDPSFIKSAVIVLLLADTTQTIAMDRSNFKPSLWTARVTSPFHHEGGVLTYKYYVEDINNKVWEENQIIHSIDINYACKQGVQDSFVSPICK